MKILLTGASGLIGRALIKHLLADKHQVVAISREPGKAKLKLKKQLGAGAASQVEWLKGIDSVKTVDDYDAIINLAGEPIIAKRWSQTQKQIIENSRWLITKQLADLINKSDNPPDVFISGSAVGYYGRQGDHDITEEFDQPFPEFSHKLCAKWEHYALTAKDKTRVCLLRTGIVLSNQGGALGKMVLPFKLGLGGSIASGEQYMPWIHMEDMVRGILFLLGTPSASGAYNLTAPNPSTNKAFSQTLAKVLGRPCLFKTPAVVLNLAMGEMACLLVYGQKAIPKRLLEAGFEFHYPDLKPALQSLNL